MFFTIGIVLAVAVGLILWKLRKGFYERADGYEEETMLDAKEDSIERQARYKSLNERIDKVIEANGGRWFTLKQLNDKLKTASGTE